MKPFTHCSFCGDRFPDGDIWPKTCTGCTKTTWRNPTPVAVLLQPVIFPDGNIRLVGIRRQNTVRSGMISPSGGFVTLGETWQEAAARESKEEANVDTDSKNIAVFDIVSAADGVILIFGIAPYIDHSQLPEFIPNFEASERIMIDEDTLLAFPIHQRVCARFFTMIKRGDILTEIYDNDHT